MPPKYPSDQRKRFLKDIQHGQASPPRGEGARRCPHHGGRPSQHCQQQGRTGLDHSPLPPRAPAGHAWTQRAELRGIDWEKQIWGGLSSSPDHRWRFRCLLASVAARRWPFPGHLLFLQPCWGDGLPRSIPLGRRRLQTHLGTTFLIYGTRAADLSQGLSA